MMANEDVSEYKQRNGFPFFRSLVPGLFLMVRSAKGHIYGDHTSTFIYLAYQKLLHADTI